MQSSTFRENAGVLVAALILVAFILIGFVVMFAMLFAGQQVPIPGDWMAAMLSLASAALGFLIGKQTSNPPAATASVPVTEQGSASVTVTTPAERPLPPPPKQGE